MRSQSARSFLFVVLALVLVSPMSANAADCTAKKLKAIAKRESGLLACSAKVAAKGDPSLEADCVAKVTAKFTDSFAKAGDCIGVASECETNVDEFCVPAVLGYLSDAGPSKCEASRLKAAGKRASAAVQCFTKKPEVRAACQSKANEKFVASFTKVSGCGGDGQESTVAASIDSNCVNAVQTTDVDGAITTLCAPVCVSPPAGSYSGSCAGCTVCSNVLSCRCADSSTSPFICQAFPEDCNPTSLHLPCSGDIANCNGTLRCGGC